MTEYPMTDPMTEAPRTKEHAEREGPEPPRLPELAEAVIDLVDQVPEGMVVTYGDLAEMIGSSGPRPVGNVMSRYGALTTWWRVLRASGAPPAGLEDEAMAHYLAEGTPLVGESLEARRVDLSRARWGGPGP